MTIDTVVEITRTAMYNIVICAAPMLIVSLIIGLIVSIFQTITSIQEQTLTFVPKFVGIFVSIMIFGHWIINNVTSFMEQLWGSFSLYIK